MKWMKKKKTLGNFFKLDAPWRKRLGGNKVVAPTMFPHGTTFSRKRGIISFKDKVPKCLKRKYRK
jgi:hypothetical protein